MAGFTTRPTLTGDFGMASTTHYQATATAMSVLERGGNAVDASVAAAFVLHVVEPHLNGPAGDVPIIVSLRGAEPTVLCGQGPAPAGASAAAYRALGLDLVPGSGPLAAAVPGAFDAWMVLLRDHGTWELDAVLEHAIGLAEAGHYPLPQLGVAVAVVERLFTEHWPTSAAVYLANGVPHPSRRFRNPALADTWRRLLAETRTASGRDARIEAARRCWSRGFIAEALTAGAAQPTLHSSGEVLPGVLSADDLAEFSAEWESTVTGGWGRWTVHKCGPWSQGPVMLQQLALLSDIEPGNLGPDDFDDDVIHRLVEQAKLALADRDTWYGDAAQVPLDELLGLDYAESRRQAIGGFASWDYSPGHPGDREPRLASHVRALLNGTTPDGDTPGSGEPTVRPPALPSMFPPPEARGDTCQLAVIDREHTIVSATPSGGWLQSNPVVPELGFPLGTRLQMAWLDEGLPNTLTPGRRPRTTLSPSLACYDGVPTLAFGTPGGDQQDQWNTNFFLHLADRHARTGRLEIQASIDAPNWHTDATVASFWPRGYLAGSLIIDGHVAPEAVEALRGRGHDVTVTEPWWEGRLCAAGLDPASGGLVAGANPRGMSGYAAGR